HGLTPPRLDHRPIRRRAAPAGRRAGRRVPDVRRGGARRRRHHAALWHGDARARPRGALALIFMRAVLALLLVIAAAAHAQSSFPSKPLRIIVPFPPGGAVDPLVRALANGMTERLAQPVIVENRPGATGTIGMNACAKSAPDGYTLCFVTSDGMTVIPALGAALPFDAEKDFEPVTLLGFAKPILVASARSPFDSFAGLVAYARANPGKVNFGTFGEGGSSHQLLEAIQHGTGTKITNVPYKGTGPALQAALAGEVDLALSILPVVLPHIKAGRLKPILVLARARLPAL